jgi:hypothetical protein
MLPLGGMWAGTCHASSDPVMLGEPALMLLCNLGYARGICPRFAGSAGPDAVRFVISSHNGTLVRLYYVLERDHHPYAHGPLEFDTATGAFLDPATDEGLRVQARAYLSSYLRRKTEASLR